MKIKTILCAIFITASTNAGPVSYQDLMKEGAVYRRLSQVSSNYTPGCHVSPDMVARARSVRSRLGIEEEYSYRSYTISPNPYKINRSGPISPVFIGGYYQVGYPVGSDRCYPRGPIVYNYYPTCFPRFPRGIKVHYAP